MDKLAASLSKVHESYTHVLGERDKEIINWRASTSSTYKLIINAAPWERRLDRLRSLNRSGFAITLLFATRTPQSLRAYHVLWPVESYVSDYEHHISRHNVMFSMYML